MGYETHTVCGNSGLGLVWSVQDIPNQLVEGGYDQSKNWKVGRSDLSKTERSDAPTFQKLRGRPLLAHNSETISQKHIKFGVSRVNILDYSLINFQVNRTYPSRVIAVGSWVRFCVDSFFSPPFRLGAANLRPLSL